MNGNLVAVIVTFNRLEKLKLTLSETFKHQFYRVVVVNNCSTDGTRNWLDELQQHNLVVIHTTSNVGGAGGFHLGFRYAAEELPEARWLVCFDDDAHPASDVVGVFQSIDIPQDVGSMAAAVYLPDGGISEMNRPSRNPFWHLRELFLTVLRGRHGFHIDDEAYMSDTPIDIDSSSFVGCFVRLSLIRERRIGLPRSEFFIYADDIVYVLQNRRAGFRHWFVPRITFSHDCQTLVNQKPVYHPLWKAYYTYRNGLELYRVASGLFFPLVLLVKIPKFFFSVRHYPQHERSKYLCITARAVWDGIRRDYSKAHDQIVALG